MNTPTRLPAASIVYLPVTQLQPNPWNRTVFDPQAMNELVASIQAEGIKEPLIVRPSGKNFEIASGNRRWLAAQQAGLTEVPCIVQDLPDQEVAEMNITVNVQREAVAPLEMARMVTTYMNQFGKTQQETAVVFGKSQTWVSALMSFLKIAPEAKENIRGLIIGWDSLVALKQAPTPVQIQVSKELKASSLKPADIIKRCNQLRFGQQRPTPAQAKRPNDPAMGADPLAGSWERVEAKTEGWTWSWEYYARLSWRFEVNIEALYPEGQTGAHKVLGQWFLAMANALGETTPDAAVAEQRQQAHAYSPSEMLKQIPQAPPPPPPTATSPKAAPEKDPAIEQEALSFMQKLRSGLKKRAAELEKD